MKNLSIPQMLFKVEKDSLDFLNVLYTMKTFFLGIVY